MSECEWKQCINTAAGWVEAAATGGQRRAGSDGPRNSSDANVPIEWNPSRKGTSATTAEPLTTGASTSHTHCAIITPATHARCLEREASPGSTLISHVSGCSG